MSLARTRTRTARSGDERTNHEATTLSLREVDSTLLFSILFALRGLINKKDTHN